MIVPIVGAYPSDTVTGAHGEPPQPFGLISLLAPQRASGIGGYRCRHRAPGPGRGHRTLVITRKGGKVVTSPLAPRTARAIDLAIGERTSGPLFLAGIPLRDVQEAASHADPHITMRYDRARTTSTATQPIVATYIAGAAR